MALNRSTRTLRNRTLLPRVRKPSWKKLRYSLATLKSGPHFSLRSLRIQMIAAIGGVLILGLGALLIIVGMLMSQMMTNSFINERRVAAAALASSSGEQIEQWRQGTQDSLKQVQNQIIDDANRLHMHVSLISPAGDLIAASKNAQPTYSDESPEIIAALRNSIGSDIRNNRLYIAAPIPAENSVNGDSISGIVWIDAALTPLQNSMANRWLMLIGITLGILIVACLVGWWLSMRIVRPVKAIQLVAEQMAGGKLDKRVDITANTYELVALGEAFNHMAERIEEMLQKQREFTANASHELRSPLATIKLRAESLSTSNLDQHRAQQYAHDISEEVTRLGMLVADLLQLSRTDQNSFAPPTDPINVNDEIKLSIKMISPRIAEHHHRLQTHVQAQLPDVLIHSRDFHIMLDNLLDNAVKYSPDSGKIDLIVYWTGTTLVINVSDTGLGIPPKDLPRISERFFRVDRTHNRTIPGTGLGLALVAATAHQYNGRLTVQSAGIPGKGTQIRLFLRPEIVPE